jgi:hypothetical protein
MHFTLKPKALQDAPKINVYSMGENGLMVDARTIEEARSLALATGHTAESVHFIQETVDWTEFYKKEKEKSNGR